MLCFSDNINFANNVIGLIDIGGKTAQGCVFEYGKPLYDTMFCIDGGGIILNNKIKTYINGKHNLNYQDYEITHITDYQQDIETIINEHIKTIKNEMQAHNWNISKLPILATGGGSARMEINKFFPNCKLSKNPIYDNVIGLHNISKEVF